MTTGNHEYDITIAGPLIKQIMVREVLPKAFVDEVRHRHNPLALRIIISWILHTKGADHPLASISDFSSVTTNFVIRQENV